MQTRGAQKPFGLPKGSTVVIRLIIAIAALWILFAVLINSAGSQLSAEAYNLLSLTPSEVLPGLHLWQVLTYSWLHDIGSLSHVLFNALALYFLGSPLERRWGGKTFLKFYVLTAFIAGLFSVLVGALIDDFDTAIVGASGAIFGLIAAFSILFPNAQIMLFFILPVQSRYLIWIALGLDVVLYFALPQYGVAIQTHMGGALGGWLLITGNWHPRIFWPKLKSLVGIRPKPFKLHVIPGGKSPSRKDDRSGPRGKDGRLLH
jgi:membrane associated rhomboid family serine protease